MIHPYSHYPARAGRHWPEQVALIDGDRSRTYAELNTNADIIARGLIKLGLEPTERVTLIQRNCIEYVESVIGIARAGGVLVPMLGALTEAEHAFMLNDTEARFIIVMAPDDDARALAIAEDPVEVLSFHSAEGVVDLSELDESGDEDCPLIDLPPSSLAHILYSSGTTGRPKGITHSYSGVSAAMNFWAEIFDLQPDDNLLGQLALSHFCGRAMDSCWIAGGTLVILPEADPEAILGAIEEHKVTMMLAVPTQNTTRAMLRHAADCARGTHHSVSSAMRSMSEAPPRVESSQSAADELVRMGHARVMAGTNSVTGRPVPQLPPQACRMAPMRQPRSADGSVGASTGGIVTPCFIAAAPSAMEAKSKGVASVRAARCSPLSKACIA